MTPDRVPKTRRARTQPLPRSWLARGREAASWLSRRPIKRSQRSNEPMALGSDVVQQVESCQTPFGPPVDVVAPLEAAAGPPETPTGTADALAAPPETAVGTGTGTLADLLPAVIGGGRQADRAPIPWKTIWATIGIVLAAAALIELVLALRLVIGLVVIATFFAIVLSPAVGGLTRIGMRRGLATGVVFVLGLAAIGGLGYLFIHPLYREATRLGNQVPDLLAKTQAGNGPLGNLISKYHLQKTAATEIPKLRHWLGTLGGPALSLARRVIAGIGGIITIGILTFLILLEGPAIVGFVLRSLPAPASRRVAGIMHDVARSVTGYVVGNTATSVIAGILCGITLALLGVPFAVVFAVWVAMVDYLPLIGGLLAGVPTVAFALLHSPTAGIITAVVFLVYQQVENHLLNPIIMSRTVKLNPLWIILSVLAGAQLASIIGALLAIPVAGAIQVIARDLWQGRRGRSQTEADNGGRAESG